MAGVLAIVGIVQEMGKGTAMGGQFSAMLATLMGDLTTLGHAAAAGVRLDVGERVAQGALLR